jgi:ribonuclease BN (tRNA processing enzyme)
VTGVIDQTQLLAVHERLRDLSKVFFIPLHADHTADLITLSGSSSKVGRADRPVVVRRRARTAACATEGRTATASGTKSPASRGQADT